VVSAVDEEGSAAEAGLLPGDRVVNLEVAGFALTAQLGEAHGPMIRTLLGNWPGPGVLLVVERNGEDVSVPLDW
jgi:hypothetical protein